MQLNPNYNKYVSCIQRQDSITLESFHHLVLNKYRLTILDYYLISTGIQKSSSHQQGVL